MYGLAAARGAHFRRRADLSLPAAAGGELPRRHAAHRARRRVLAQHPEGEGPPDHHAVAARLRSARRLPTTRPWCCASPERGARRAAVRRRAADLLAGLLRQRPFDETTLDVPLGCGPYKVGRFEPGRYIEYERVKDWWGADLPVSRGQNNFDTVRFEYYRDRDVAFEGFTGRELSVPRGVHLAHLGDALRFSRHQGRPGEARGARRTTRRPARRAGSSTRGAEVQGSASCARRWSLRSISSGPTRTSCTAPTTARTRCSRTPR